MTDFSASSFTVPLTSSSTSSIHGENSNLTDMSTSSSSSSTSSTSSSSTATTLQPTGIPFYISDHNSFYGTGGVEFGHPAASHHNSTYINPYSVNTRMPYTFVNQSTSHHNHNHQHPHHLSVSPSSWRTSLSSSSSNTNLNSSSNLLDYYSNHNNGSNDLHANLSSTSLNQSLFSTLQSSNNPMNSIGMYLALVYYSMTF